jgi:D-alanine-D-alanine ligase-like ATP-grasp enzyme
MRADAEIIEEADLDGFQRESGPVHVQRYVPGADARIHVVGDRIVSQRLSAGTIDYRREASWSGFEVFVPPSELCGRLIEGTRGLGLAFAGWDFKIGADGVYWCLEVNPMPAYSPYDARCSGAISHEILRYLGGEGPRV